MREEGKIIKKGGIFASEELVAGVEWKRHGNALYGIVKTVGGRWCGVRVHVLKNRAAVFPGVSHHEEMVGRSGIRAILKKEADHWEIHAGDRIFVLPAPPANVPPLRLFTEAPPRPSFFARLASLLGVLGRPLRFPPPRRYR